MIQIIETFAFSPYLIVFIGFAVQTLLLFGFCWNPRNYVPRGKIREPLYLFLKSGVYFAFFLFGIFMLDTAIVWLLGGWGYADYRYQLPCVLFGLIIGFEILFGTVLVNPKIEHLLFAGVFIGVFEYLMHWYVPSTLVPHISTDLLGPIFLVGLGVVIVGGMVGYGLRYLYIRNQENFNGVRSVSNYGTLWNIRPTYQKIYSRKTIRIIWIFIFAETLLKLYGSSLFL